MVSGVAVYVLEVWPGTRYEELHEGFAPDSEYHLYEYGAVPPDGPAVKVTLSPGFNADADAETEPGESALFTVTLSTEEHCEVPDESVTL